jgi:gluconokinase
MRIRRRKTVRAAASALAEPVRLVVMGVTGCGKSTVGSAIAAAIGARFCDGDSLHSAVSVEKMRRGEPLTDEDRWPWFGRIATFLNSGESHTVIACSALRKSYRDYLRQGVPNIRFLFLDARPELITQRVATRRNHYMPVSLVESQFATLERPDNERGVTTVPADAQLKDILRCILPDLP